MESLFFSHFLSTRGHSSSGASLLAFISPAVSAHAAIGCGTVDLTTSEVA